MGTMTGNPIYFLDLIKNMWNYQDGIAKSTRKD